MRRAARQPRSAMVLTLALLAWFAQLCLPLAHAAVMSAPGKPMPAWCGEPARALAIAAELPAELREALGLGNPSADHLAGCAELCATGAAPPSAAVPMPVVLPAADVAPSLAALPLPRAPQRALTPPAQGPPAAG